MSEEFWTFQASREKLVTQIADLKGCYPGSKCLNKSATCLDLRLCLQDKGIDFTSDIAHSRNRGQFCDAASEAGQAGERWSGPQGH